MVSPLFKARFYLVVFCMLSLLLLFLCMISLTLSAVNQNPTTTREITRRGQAQRHIQAAPLVLATRPSPRSGLQPAQHALSLVEEIAGQSVNILPQQVAGQQQAFPYQGTRWWSQQGWSKTGKASGKAQQKINIAQATDSPTATENPATSEKPENGATDQDSYFNMFTNPAYTNRLSDWATHGEKLKLLPGFGQ